MLFTVFLFLFFVNQSTSKITERQYALMPPLFHYDNYDHCMLHGKEALYCAITFQLQPQNILKPSKTWRILEKISSKPTYYRHDLLRHGICVHETCPNITLSQNHPKFLPKLEECYNKKYKNKGIIGRITKLKCETKTSPYSYKSFDKIFGFLVVFFIVLVLLASFCDLLERDSKFVSLFSLLQNWKRLNFVHLDKPDIRALRCIQGVRFYSTVCVIFGHTVLGNFAIPVSNPRYAESLDNKVHAKLIGNAFRYAIVQIFFMMSAWLSTYHFFIELEGKSKVSVWYLLLSFIKRYIRLTPSLAIMVGVHATWMVHLSRGPFWDHIVGSEYRLCAKNGWSNLLYLNNYIHGPEMCSGHHWYTAVDTQLNVLGLLLLTVLWYKQNKVVLILGSFWVFHFVSTFLTIYKNSWELLVPLRPELLYDLKISNIDKIFVILKSNTSNLGSFVVGMAYGYAFYKYRNQKLFRRKYHVTLWWILWCGLILGSVVFPVLLERQNHLLYQAVSGSLRRSVFAVAVGLWMFGVTQGEGSITKLIIEWSPLYILGRLTYSAFLVHTFFQRIKIGSKRGANYVDSWSLFFDTISDVGAAFLGGAFLTLFFEMPIIETVKHIATSRYSKKKDGTVLRDNKAD